MATATARVAENTGAVVVKSRRGRPRKDAVSTVIGSMHAAQYQQYRATLAVVSELCEFSWQLFPIVDAHNKYTDAPLVGDASGERASMRGEYTTDWQIARVHLTTALAILRRMGTPEWVKLARSLDALASTAARWHDAMRGECPILETARRMLDDKAHILIRALASTLA